MSGRVILRDLDLGDIRQQISVLETFSRDAMPDDSLEAQKLADTLELLKRIERQLANPVSIVTD